MTALSRRGALGLGAMTAIMAATGASAALKPRSFFRRGGWPLAVQLYSFGSNPSRDLDGTLARIAEIGYKSVELSSFFQRTPQQLRTALDRAGLTCPSTQFQSHPLIPGMKDPTFSTDIDTLVTAARTLGSEYVVMPMFKMPDRLKLIPKAGEDVPKLMARLGGEMSLDDWKYNAGFLNEKGAAMKKAGLKLAYHNHNMEFTPVGGTYGFDVLLKETDPDLVWFEMDAGWITAAGDDPLRFLREHPGRFRLMHLRDIERPAQPSYAPGQGATELGTGSVNWKKLLPSAYAHGIRNFIVEREPVAGVDGFQATAADLRYLKSLTV